MNQNFVRPLLLALTATVAAGFVTGCSHAVAQSQPPPPPSVTVAAAQQKQIVEWSEFTGRTEPVESVDIRPRVSGYIQEVRFKSGQLVTKGDVLFIIDPRFNQAAYDQREAVYEQAKSENDRTENLLKNNAISKEEAGARQARYLAAKADLESAKLDLEYTEVRAPISGRVSRALLTEGNYVSGIAGAASLLTTLVSVDPVYVYATIDEDSYLKYNNLVHAQKLDADSDGHVPVQLQLADETEFSHQGYIESFDNRLDPNTGSILVRAVFTNENDRLVPGLFAHIRIPLSERHDVVLVDERAIGTDQAQKFVLTVTATNTVAYRQVELGPLADGKRIVRSGLSAGEKIVVNGLQRVRPGMPVTPEPEPVAAVKPVPQKLAQR
ncbi:MAG TPA: efflux RND transporter periplasmic adaptor subunit [Verrucomicrobiae bacterium]|nr:efflux RND transporter periplasmic adaptor subunit [Verrucomicrobiae bacterium]